MPICFALGYDVSVRCVLSLFTLRVSGERINLVKGKISYSEINHCFNIILDSSSKGLPDDNAFDNIIPTIPPGVWYNIKATLFLSIIYLLKDVIFLVPNLVTLIISSCRITFFCSNASWNLEYISEFEWNIVRKGDVAAGKNRSEIPWINSSELRSGLNFNSFKF